MDETWLLHEGDKDTGTSQHCRGAQWLLKGHNVLGRVWYDGPVDGDFGAKSAAAAKRCKYELGYTTASVQPTFGPTLRDYLTGAQRRSPLMLIRARRRARKLIWPTSPHGTVIGWPGVGTHSFIAPPNNWESDQAWDISVALKSNVLAVADGEIGTQFGPLPDPDPRYHGIRLHLVTAENEFYYAHLSSTFPGLGPGDKVKQGQILGKSGIANGVPHLHIGVRHQIKLEEL